jgi:hypothetical protein
LLPAEQVSSEATLCKALAGAGYTSVTLDNLSRGHVEFVSWGPFERRDIIDQATLDQAFSRHRPTAVIHFAGRAYVVASFEHALRYFCANISGLLNVLDAMVRHDTKTIVFSSTCATYGIPHRVPIRETAPQVPINPYGRSKLACEQIIRDVAAAHDLRLAMLRYFNAEEQILTATWSSGMIRKRTSSLSPWMPQAAIAPRRRFLEGITRPRTEPAKGISFMCPIWQSAHVMPLQHLLTDESSLTINLGNRVRPFDLGSYFGDQRTSGRDVPVVESSRRPADTRC